MKNLIYKEIKLSIPIAAYLFVVIFPVLFSLTPSFGSSISFIYCVVGFQFLLLGANKGRSTNDIYYSLLLPIRKRDIIKGKMFSFVYLEVINIISTLVGTIISYFLLSKTQKQNPIYGLGLKEFGLLICVSLIALSVVNLIFFVLYFKNARSITLPMILSLIFITIFMGFFGVGLPTILVTTNQGIWEKLISVPGQIIAVVIGLIIFMSINYLAYILSSKEFEKSDQ